MNSLYLQLMCFQNINHMSAIPVLSDQQMEEIDLYVSYKKESLSDELRELDDEHAIEFMLLETLHQTQDEQKRRYITNVLFNWLYDLRITYGSAPIISWDSFDEDLKISFLDYFMDSWNEWNWFFTEVEVIGCDSCHASDFIEYCKENRKFMTKIISILLDEKTDVSEEIRENILNCCQKYAIELMGSDGIRKKYLSWIKGKADFLDILEQGLWKFLTIHEKAIIASTIIEEEEQVVRHILWRCSWNEDSMKDRFTLIAQYNRSYKLDRFEALLSMDPCDDVLLKVIVNQENWIEHYVNYKIN